MRKTLKLTVSLLVLGALVFSGVAWAQTEEAVDETSIEDRPAYAGIIDVLQPLVEDGTISEDQAEAVAEALTEAIPRRPCRGPGHRLRVAGLETADFLGITVEELRDALSDGATLAEIAAANGSSAEALIDHLVGVVEGHLDEAIADGRITEDEAADRLAEATDHITDLVSGELPDPAAGPGFGGRHGRFGGGEPPAGEI